MNVVRAAATQTGCLELIWSDESRSSFHPLWLRDHCHCPACGDPAIGRRTLRLSDIDPAISLSGANVSENGDTVTLQWSDAHQADIAAEWLHGNRYDATSAAARLFQPKLWDQVLLDSPPTLPFTSINEDDGLHSLLTIIRDSGLCLLSDAPAETGVLERFASRIGPIQESNFGRVQDLIADKSRLSIANDIDELKPHTDEPYRASPPGILLFHCIETDINGAGQSIFTDGFSAAECLRLEDPQGFRALTENPQAFRRHFADDVDLIAEFPVISCDRFGNVCGVRINDRVAAPVNVPPDQLEIYYRGMSRLLGLVEDQNRMIFRTLQPGDIAVFDNHRILHGRTRLTMRGRRWLQWVQIERGDAFSRLRILSDRLHIEKDMRTMLRGAYG